MKDILSDDLNALREKGLWRSLRTVESSQDREIMIDGKKVLNFCSNNYLGLASDPRLVEASKLALEHEGVGSGASQLVGGHMRGHKALEEELARMKGSPAALIFSTGYMANLGIISALVGREDVVFSDRLNHASIVDGVILSRAEHVRYAHKDMTSLEEALRTCTGTRRKLIVTDTIFSMDGDVAPLREIVALAKRYGAWVMVDEAHAFGVFGKNGSGIVEELGLVHEVDIQMGTLSKAAGSFGAYCAGSRELIDYLVNCARSFIFTTALPPSVVAAGLEAVRIIQKEPARRQKLLDNAGWLRQEIRGLGFDTLESMSPIIPLLLGDAQLAIRVSRALFERGVFVQAIRPPAVPVNTSRLRLTVMATHTADDLRQCVESLRDVKKTLAV